jgi:hypothetical protein
MRPKHWRGATCKIAGTAPTASECLRRYALGAGNRSERGRHLTLWMATASILLMGTTA